MLTFSSLLKQMLVTLYNVPNNSQSSGQTLLFSGFVSFLALKFLTASATRLETHSFLNKSLLVIYAA